MKLKELLKVLDPETLFKVRIASEMDGRGISGRQPTIQCLEIRNYMDNEVESVLWTQHNGILIFVDKEKSPRG